MSYVVSIRKAVAITSTELLSAVENDPEFTIPISVVECDDCIVEFAWRSSENTEPEYFVLSQGVVDVTTPSNNALTKMQDLAGILGAQVFGEEGEELTNVEGSDVMPGGCGPATWTSLLLLVILVAYWLLN